MNNFYQKKQNFYLMRLFFTKLRLQKTWQDWIIDFYCFVNAQLLKVIFFR